MNANTLLQMLNTYKNVDEYGVIFLIPIAFGLTD